MWIFRREKLRAPLSKKARPPPGGIAAMKLYYTMQV